MGTTTDITIATLAARQIGHVTRSQLLEAGLSPAAVWRRSRAGLLVPVGSRTFRLASAPTSPEGAVLAACLDLGAVASHRTAGWLHGWLPHPGLVEVTVPRSAGRRSGDMAPPGVVLHTSTALPRSDLVTVRGVPTLGVARSLLSLGALVPGPMTQEQLAEVMATACESGQAREKWLFWLLESRRIQGRDGVVAFEEALAARVRLGPTESWLEREVLRIIEAAGLELPRVQRRVARRGRFVARVDFAYPGRAVAMEALGHRHHRTREQTERDTRRANRLQHAGLKVFQWTYGQVVDDPGSVVADVAAILGVSLPHAA